MSTAAAKVLSHISIENDISDIYLAVLEVSLCALTTIVKLLLKFLTLTFAVLLPFLK